MSEPAGALDGFVLRREWGPLGDFLRDLRRSGPLVLTLARQNFYVRYRRASFGILWAVGLPLFQALVLAFVFSKVLRFGRTEHFAVFLLAGITAWNFFNSSVQAAATSIVDGAGLSTRIYFPRMVFPLVTVAANLYGFVLSLGVLIVVALISGVPLGLRLLWLFPGTAVLLALTTGMAVVLSGLHVYFRDLRYILQAIFIAWFYVTPVLYSLEQARQFSDVLPFNPATGVVLLFRAAILGKDQHFALSIAVSVAWAVVLLVIGLVVQRRFDRVFSDLL